MSEQAKTQDQPDGRVSRRNVLKAAMAAGGAAVLGFPMIAKGQGPIAMRWQSTWPAKDIFHEFALDFAKKVNDMTGGDLKIEVLPAGAVVLANPRGTAPGLWLDDDRGRTVVMLPGVPSEMRALLAEEVLPRLAQRVRDLRARLNGAYVEARTAEVFTGGCIMNSEAETMGRQAVLAWKVDRGSFNGVAIDGLSIVAALSGDRNLGMVEMGGEKAAVRSAMFVDQRANPAQQIALVAMASTFGALNGRVAHACVWSLALTDSEVRALYDPTTRWELYHPLGRKTFSFGTRSKLLLRLQADGAFVGGGL